METITHKFSLEQDFEVQWIFLYLTKHFAQNKKFIQVIKTLQKFLPKTPLLKCLIVVVVSKHSLQENQFMSHSRFYF